MKTFLKIFKVFLIFIVVAFVGCMEDESETPIRGNGKTTLLTGNLYEYKKIYYKRIWTNYFTTFSERKCSITDMFIDLERQKKTDKNINVIIGITEMSKLINSIGSDNKKILFIDYIFSQIRKFDIDFLYDCQRFKNVNLRLRVHTDVVIKAEKYHLDGEPCYNDRCMNQEHIIQAISLKPERNEAISYWYASIVNQLFNTREFCEDKLDMEKVEEMIGNGEKKKK